MVNICFYFQVHQPFRMRNFTVFDIGKNTDYFDEQKSEPCGICDVCLEKKNSVPEELEVKILDLLSKNNLNSQEIFTQLKTKESWVIESLKNLLNQK